MDSKLNIGLVDDHQLFRESLRFMIEASDEMNVSLEADNGLDFFEKLNNGVFPDVILMDMEMPEMDGMKTCEKLKELHPDSKILVLTMHEDTRLVQYMMKQGANGYILKTAKWNELKSAILQVNEKGYFFSDLVSLAMLQNLQKPGKLKPQIGPVPTLSPREQEVLIKLAQGKTTSEIAEELYLSTRTVEGHRANLLKRLEVSNTAGLIVKALKLELISLSDL